jgi:hypothetical protein
MHLSGEAYTIEGVMPASFRFPADAPQNTFWTTLAVDNNGMPGTTTANRGDHELAAMGRLKPGIREAQADAEMKAIAAGLSRKYPASNTQNNSAHVQSELKAMLPLLPFFQLSDVAELTLGRAVRVFAAHSLRSIVLRQEPNVFVDFVGERIVLAALHRLPFKPRPHGSQSAHRVTPVSRASACAP